METLGPLGPVVAAVITAIIALVGLIISKESKTSEFRQAWIDALRADVAILLAQANQVRRYVASEEPSGADQDLAYKALALADTALFSIRLRLNPKEAKSQAVLAILDEIEEFSNQEEHPSEQAMLYEARLTSAAKDVLKAEWDRVRRGELTFRFARFLAVIAVTGFSLLFAYSIVVAREGEASPRAVEAGKQKIDSVPRVPPRLP